MGKVVVQAQLFARTSIALEAALSIRTPFKDKIIEGRLSVEKVTPLYNDILVNWDTTYSQVHFETCMDFGGPVDKECNCQIPATKVNQVPLIQNLVDTFSVKVLHLSVDMVWKLSSQNQVVDFTAGTGTST